MSAKPESTFIESVHRHLSPTLYRIKNHNVFNAGIADVWYSGTSADLWIEYKFIVVPKRLDTVIDMVGGKKPDISHLQQDWLRARHAEGRNVGVIIGSKLGGVWLPGISWDRTFTTEEFLADSRERKSLANIITDLVG